VQPSHHLLTLQEDRELNVELYVNKGRGYVESDQHPVDRGLPVDLVRIDAIYNPVRRANFSVAETRVGQLPVLNPLIASIRDAVRCAVEDDEQGGNVDVFGGFRLVIAGYEVRFARRRDAQIVEYLALKPDGTATRSELIRAFWPESDPGLASQSLRTACSTIRRSIAECAGRAAVERYFRVGKEQIQLVFDALTNPLVEFHRHIEAAAEAETRAEYDLSRTHWSAAARLFPEDVEVPPQAPAPLRTAIERANEIARQARTSARIERQHVADSDGSGRDEPVAHF
jgi:hypothetical protein